MNITKVAAWSEIVSSVAVLATLAYLAVQVQQNTAAIQSQSRQAMLATDLSTLALTTNDPGILLDRSSPDELSPARKMRLHSNLTSVLRTREYQWFEYQNGLLDEAAWRAFRTPISLVFLGTKRTRGWWNDMGREGFDPQFVNMVDGLIKDQPYSTHYERILALE